jgi:hypothetical protein
MLIGSSHRINLGPAIPENFSLLLRSPSRVSWVRGSPISLEIDLSEFPALKKWVDEIDKRAAVLRAFVQPRLEDRVETSCLIDKPLNSVVGARVGEA